MSAAAASKEREFGLSVGGVSALLAGVWLWRGHPDRAAIAAAAAAALVVPALVRPSLLKAPSAAWWTMARALGWVNARVLLSALFAVLITPLGVVLRVCGWDPLRLSRRRGGSGWVPSPERQRDPKHYDRMY